MPAHRLEPVDPAERARVGQTLRTFREMRGMRQTELAAAMGLSRTHLAHVERGTKRLTPVMLARAASVLQVPQVALFARADDGTAA